MHMFNIRYFWPKTLNYFDIFQDRQKGVIVTQPHKKRIEGLTVIQQEKTLVKGLNLSMLPGAVYGSGAHTFSLATGSPGELGMLEAMAEAFNPKFNTRLCWQKAGSGKSLQLLKEKKIDMVMVHAPAAEKQAVTEGWAIKRNLIGQFCRF